MNNKGFTLVELLAVVVILALILAIAVPAISNLINQSKNNSIESAAKMLLNTIRLKELEDSTFDATTLNETNLTSLLKVPSTDYKSVMIKKVNGENYITIVGQNKFEGYTTSGIKTDVSTYLTSTTTYTNGANAPELVTGMTPIKWNGSAWVDTTANDSSWYNYDTTSKLWANARTADGSMWVWIPRYIYKIPTDSWHTETAQIEIQFSKGINDNWNNAIIGNLSLTGTADASNNKWTNHPAFTFGSMEVTGIWVSKFEASNNGGKVKVTPNVQSWTNINLATMYNASRSMENDTTYGWGTSGTNLDTHMMKNVEWGAVLYLSSSTYGKNSQIWTNNINTDLSFTYGPTITGCSGASATASMIRSATCPVGNTYETATGINASASGNITGIYDMSGGSDEYVMGNLDNLPASSGLTISSVASKYYDKYISINNTSYNKSTYGDAYYETSSGAYSNCTKVPPLCYAWYSGGATVTKSDIPWISRGGYYYLGRAFSFSNTYGQAMGQGGFRPVIIVGSGL